MGGSKRWCFTLNNPTHLEIDAYNGYDEVAEYLVVGLEVGASGTTHIQGYVHFKTRKGLAAVKKLLPMARAHLEIARGRGNEAADYCKKDGVFAEIGTVPSDPADKGGEGMKKKWQEIIKLSEVGDYDTLKRDHPREYVVNHVTIKRLRQEYAYQSSDAPKGIWIYGRSGCGK